MKDKKALHTFTKRLLDFMFCSGILVCILVPFLINWYAQREPLLQNIRLPLIAVLLVSGTIALYIIWELRKIFKTLIHSNPFIEENANALRRIASASFVISAAYFSKCFFWFTLATVIIVIIFAILGLFCLVLADVFQQAVEYKEENDLTV